jgi:hypothetical protein
VVSELATDKFKAYTEEMRVLKLAYAVGPLSEGEVPERLIEPIDPNRPVPAYVSWKFWHNGKQWGQWIVLRTAWEIDNAALIGRWHAQEHLKAVGGDESTREPERLRMWMFPGGEADAGVEIS